MFGEPRGDEDCRRDDPAVKEDMIARKQGYVCGLRTAMAVIVKERVRQNYALWATSKPCDSDLHAEHRHAIEVLNGLSELLREEIRKAKT